MTDQINKIPAHPTKQPSFTRSLLSVGGANSITLIFLFLEMMIAVRILDPASYGIFVLLIAVTNFCIMMIDCGCKTALPQMIASSEPARQTTLVNSIMLFRMIIIVAAFLLILPARHWLESAVLSPEIFHYAFLILLMIITNSYDELFNSILQGFHAYRHIAISTCLRSALRLALTIIFLAVLKLGMLGLVCSWFISAGVSAIYQLIVTPIPRRLELNRSILNDALKFGFPLQVSRFIWFISGRMNVFLLGILALPVSVALYDVGEKIPNALQNLSASFITVFYPSITSLIAEGNMDGAERMLKESLRLISFVAAFFAMVAVVFHREIVVVLFSARYSSASTVFAILMTAFQVGFLVQLMGYTLTSAGYPGRSLIENTVRAFVIVAGNIILIPRIGILGAALATLIANYISIPLSVWLLKRSNITVKFTFFIRTTLIFLLCVAMCWLFHPTSLVIKSGILLLFIILNLSLSTITWDDLALVVPKFLTRRMSVLQKV